MQTKQISLLSSVLVLSAAMTSNAVAATPLTGPYIGLNVGVFSNVLIEENDRDFETVVQFAAEQSPFSRLDLKVGFSDLREDGFYLGGEFSYTILNELDDTYADAGNRWSTEGGTGFAFKLMLGGQLASESVAYGIVGFQQRNFEQTVSFNGGSFSEDEDFSGLGIGLGFKHSLTENLALTTEAFRVDYSSESFDGIKFDLIETQVDLGLSYHF